MVDTSRTTLFGKSSRCFSIGLVVLTLLRVQQERTFITNIQPTPPTSSATGNVPTDLLAVNPRYGNASAQTNTDAEQDNAYRPSISKHKLMREGNEVDFNYTAYWEQAMEVALKSQRSEAMPSPSPCPKVFVYDLPSKLKDSTKKEHGFGRKIILRGKDKPFQGLLHNTNQFSFPSILEQRLKQSKLCRTNNPKEADLFYVPVLTAPKARDEWEAACSKITGQDIRDALPYLNETNACRHFFAFGKGHYVSYYCRGWFSEPIDELKPFLRLAYSHRSFHKHSNGTHSYSYAKDNNMQSFYPNLFSVPYPSSLHFSKSQKDLPQFKNPSKRNSLMTFVGKDDHGDTQVRQEIARACKQYKDRKICAYYKQWATKLALSKSKATFCLEPAGDSPWRKSLADSISFGCIPVLFSELTDDVAPWFWKEWKDRARVLVPRDEFVAGRVDLQKLLQSIPKKLLELMQTTLKEKARQFQYSIDDDQQDGIRIVLDNLHREVMDREQRGVCGHR